MEPRLWTPSFVVVTRNRTQATTKLNEFLTYRRRISGGQAIFYVYRKQLPKLCNVGLNIYAGTTAPGNYEDCAQCS